MNPQKSRITIKANAKSENGQDESINIDLLFLPTDAMKIATYALQLFSYRKDHPLPVPSQKRAKNGRFGTNDDDMLAKDLENIK